MTWTVCILAASALMLCGIVIGIVYAMWPENPEDDPLA